MSRWSVLDSAGQTNAADEAPANDFWRAYGDTNSAGDMVNTEPHWNNVIMQIVRENDPIGDDSWQARNLDDPGDTTQQRESGAIRDVKLKQLLFASSTILTRNLAISSHEVREKEKLPKLSELKQGF